MLIGGPFKTTPARHGPFFFIASVELLVVGFWRWRRGVQDGGGGTMLFDRLTLVKDYRDAEFALVKDYRDAEFALEAVAWGHFGGFSKEILYRVFGPVWGLEAIDVRFLHKQC
jgi:hypothetical protein